MLALEQLQGSCETHRIESAHVYSEVVGTVVYVCFSSLANFGDAQSSG